MDAVRLIQVLALASVTAVVAGCAAVETKVVKKGDEASGLVYHLPVRYFILTLVRNDANTETASWVEGPLLPDLSKTYLLKHRRHLFAKSDIDLVIGPTGLLGSAKSTLTDSVAEISKAFPQATKDRMIATTREAPPVSCGPGTSVFAFDPTDLPKAEPRGGDSAWFKLCGDVEISIAPVGGSGMESINDDAESTGGARHGVYYRQLRPYRVMHRILTADGQVKVETASILMAPNGSPTAFLPFTETLFSANDGTITFTDGIPINYRQTVESEFLAMLKLPASLLSAYFNAVGGVFTAFSANAQAEQDLANQKFILSTQALKIQQCTAALRQNDTKLLESLGCSDIDAK